MQGPVSNPLTTPLARLPAFLYIQPMTKADPKLVSRLSRIEGQVRGVARMLEEERYCIDVLDQVQAVKAALKKVEDEILKGHAAHCVRSFERAAAAHDPAPGGREARGDNAGSLCREWG